MTGKDPTHWLHRLSAREWIDAAMNEIRKAEGAYKANDARGGLAGARRAAGMALNGALVIDDNPSWGRTYMEHLAAVAKDGAVPRVVSEGAKLLIESKAPGHTIVGLRSKAGDERVLEAAKDVMAHAYALMVRAEGVSK